MKTGKLKFGILAVLCAVALATAFAGAGLFKINAYAEGEGAYSENYRNKLAYSPLKGWNNDPNGLVYVDGVYHMYYQYNYNQNVEGEKTENGWGNMSWGHAVSTDLVHWEEKEVAIPAWQTVGENFYGMFFSGSAVYDEKNTSGLFEGNKGGIVAVMTQPCWNEELKYDVQRQILAYSTDGNSFEIYGEILGMDDDGGLGDNEFRDPKVFWNAKLNKWLMAVGGGSVRMYSSGNLKEWEYLGETGYWGECPDLSRFEVNGEEKYVLIISPEDKAKSHEYNGTNRVNTYYPAEYYVVGELDENGLFYSTQSMMRLSEGIDSYAFQSFNGAPDGKVYGVSWSASWLTVGEYERFREHYNGGMTVVCELELAESDGEYTLLRKPVTGIEALRGERIKKVSIRQKAGLNAFNGVRVSEADIDLTLDFAESDVTYAELDLRVSAVERIILKYDTATQILSLDRSQSSLIAKDTKFFKQTYEKAVPLDDNKLNLRILLDRAFISVFANGGYASFFSAVFPSAVSNGIRLLSDGDIGVSADIYAVESIFGAVETNNSLVLTTDKIDVTVGSTTPVILSSYSSPFNTENVTYTASNGNISVETAGGICYIKALKKGSATVEASYGGQMRTIEVYIYENGLESNVKFTEKYRGFSLVREDGLLFSAGEEDAFIFGDAEGKNFTYSANFTPLNDAQAGGLVIGYTGNASGFWFVTADIKENRVKLVEFRGEKQSAETLCSVKYDFTAGASYKLSVTVTDGQVKVFVNGESASVLMYTLQNYRGGRVGINVYNSEMAINRISFGNTVTADGAFDTRGETVVKVVNVTDGSYKLKSGEYTVTGGKLQISAQYLATLEADTEYLFRIVTSVNAYDFTVTASFTQAVVTPLKEEYMRGDELKFAISSGAEVYKVEINGRECAYTSEQGIITVSADEIKALTGGTHTVKVYTAKGRPVASFEVLGLEDFREEEVEAVSHTFFYIDIAIFAVLIAGYVTFSLISKRKVK